MKNYGHAIIRYGVALVFLIFGVWQLIDPASWLGYVPPFVPLDTMVAVYLNGLVDVILGIMLALGFFTRIVAIVAAVHLIAISVVLGFNDVAVRDYGLVIVLVGIAMHGPDDLCLETQSRT